MITKLKIYWGFLRFKRVPADFCSAGIILTAQRKLKGL